MHPTVRGTSRGRSRRSLAAGLGLIGIGVIPCAAQTISGTVATSSALSGIPGVIVQLLDSAGVARARALSRPDGAFTLRAPDVGRFTIRTQRLGFRASTFGPYSVGDSGLTRLRLSLDEVPVSLAALRVSSSSACTTAGASDDGVAVLTAWEEARKSLLSSILSRGRTDLVVTTTTYDRVVAPATGRVVRQTVAQRSGRSDRPFISPLSPERYATAGYRETDSAGTTTYRAPDADVLVSPEFAEGHCLYLVEGKSDAEVGVAFGPRNDAPDRRAGGAPFVDVEGVLWLDRRSNRLLRADIRYTGVEPAARAAGAGSTLEFLSLPAGLVVVSSWSIRAPRLAITTTLRGDPTSLGSDAPARLQSQRRETVGELWVFGGELTRAATGDSVYRREANAEVVGSTIDTRSHRAIPGTRVTLAGTPYTAVSDSTGRYRLGDVLPGTYDVVVHSDLAAHLQLPATTAATITLHARETKALTLETSGTGDAVAMRCGSQARGERSAIVGMVTTFSGSAMPDAFIHASWTDSYSIQRDTYGERRMAALVRADAGGWFFLCGVPRARPIDIAVVADSTASAILGSTRVRVPQDDAYLRADLQVSMRRPVEARLP